MKISSIFLPFAAVALIPAGAQAGQEQGGDAAHHEAQAPDASIPFANHGGVRNWRADGDRTVYFQDSHGRWYKAELLSRAMDLPYANAIGIDAGATGRLDRFGAIVVKGQRYTFTSFVMVDGPPVKNAKEAEAG